MEIRQNANERNYRDKPVVQEREANNIAKSLSGFPPFHLDKTSVQHKWGY